MSKFIGWTISEWQKAAYARSKANGFKENEDQISQCEKVAVLLINMHGEISEAWEAYRAGKLNAPCDKAAKMEALGLRPLTCLEEELADIGIRLLDSAEALGVNLEEVIGIKHEYNGSRPYKHGGKLA